MPRKQNGFGNPGSFAFKGIESKVGKGKKKGAAGDYPSNRRYGASVKRTIIEEYNLNSDWTRWRKGFEYYNLAAYLEFAELETVMYQGTADATRVKFTGERFATKNADSNTHYSLKREVIDSPVMGRIGRVFNDRSLYPDNYSRREIWAEVLGTKGANTGLLRRCIGDRITDGKTAANIINVMTDNLRPAVYKGKTLPDNRAKCFVTIPKADLGDINVEDLINEVLVLEEVRVERPITGAETFIDDDYAFTVKVTGETGVSKVRILDDDATILPPSVLEIRELTAIVDSSGTYEINADYVFDKSEYQRFFAPQYLAAELVEQEVGTISFAVFPFKILAASIEGNQVKIESQPFMSSVQLFAKDDVGFLVLNDKSFTTQEVDQYDGVYYHKLGAPGDPLWERLNTDVDPWMDEVFVDGGFINFADVYACSCPDYLHAILRMPEVDNDGNRINRQRRAPLPTAQGNSSYNQLGFSTAAGTASSWETLDYKTSHRICKHTVASHFNNKIKVVEPKSYPTLEAREAFEQKVEADIKEVADEFLSQLKRSEITTLEIVATLGIAMNYDEVELANLIISSTF